MLKTSMLGLGAIAALAVLWKLFATVFVIAFVAFKIFVFIVLPIGFAIWFYRKVMRSEPRSETTST